MPQSRFDWHERIKAVEREYWAVWTAVNRLADAVAQDPTLLGKISKPRDLTAAVERLEGTYVMRMFAEFETAIRSYWRTIKPKARTPVEVMLNRVADRLTVPTNVRLSVHSVREYRNHLVHERDQDLDPVAIKDARHWLATYLARLPKQWGD